MTANIREKAQIWATSSTFDEATRKEISHLIEANNDKELTERFYRELEFGTGGMRGILGAGTNRMNIYNVRKASFALASYVKEHFSKEKDLKIALSHDSRRFSREFAKAAAEVFAAQGIKALITKELRPVPMLSFMTRHYKCHAGVCVTASHNPPNYNGYKVYWQTGGQIVAPHDKEIIKRFLHQTSYHIPHLPYEEALKKGLIEEVGKELDEAYFSRVEKLSFNKEGREGFKIVYSPLHGSGLYPVTEMLKRVGFNDVNVVAEQREPNGDFPTVKYPNPEEPEALTMALNLAKKTSADLVFATDPDCDRIGIVYREGSEYKFLNGNQIGCLLNDYVLRSMKAKKLLPENPLVIKTVVTTDLQEDIAKEYGAACEETLTGFKWICQRIEDYETGTLKPYRKFICGGEESYGFLADSFVRDKDAVIACMVAAEMTAWYKSQNMTLTQALDQIFTKHGVYQESLHTLTLPGKEGAERIKAMMERLRANPPRLIDGKQVTKLRDFELRQELSVHDSGLKKVNDLTHPQSDVLQFILVDGTKVSIRPSGTEPKIKFYISVKEPRKGLTGKELEQAKETCKHRVKSIEHTFVALAEG